MAFSTCYIKNTDTVNHSIIGKEIVPNEEYQIPDTVRISAANNSDILDKISQGKLQIVKEYKLLVDPNLEMEIRKACWHDCGKYYGMLQNIGIFLVDLGICKDTPWKSGRNCSELLYLKVFKQLITDLNYNPDTIKPHEIEEIILKYFKNQEGHWVLK